MIRKSSIKLACNDPGGMMIAEECGQTATIFHTTEGKGRERVTLAVHFLEV